MVIKINRTKFSIRINNLNTYTELTCLCILRNNKTLVLLLQNEYILVYSIQNLKFRIVVSHN